MYPEHVMRCDWFAFDTGDHRPVYLADSESVPSSNYAAYREIYNQLNDRCIIQPTWRQSECG